MATWPFYFAVGIFVLWVLLIAWALCRAAGDADDQLEHIEAQRGVTPAANGRPTVTPKPVGRSARADHFHGWNIEEDL